MICNMIFVQCPDSQENINLDFSSLSWNYVNSKEIANFPIFFDWNISRRLQIQFNINSTENLQY